MKQKVVFACQECGSQSGKWLGRCPDCGAWNSLVEERAVPAELAAAGAEKRYALAAAAGPQLYADIDTVVAERLSTGIGEFDRVLGGGVVPGSLVLIGGEPGIGKSTLLLQAAAHFAKAVGPVLYSSGEESEHQIKSRGERLGVERAPLYILAETCLERILEEIARLRPGEGTGYGMKSIGDAPRTVAVVPAGYADGLDTRLAGRGYMLVRGRRAPIVGSVCMDMTIIDVTGMDAAPGDEVVIVGSQGEASMGVREMAAAIGTIPYELLCRVGTRIQRVYE